MWFAPPREIAAVRAFSRLPEALRHPRRSAWADANATGAALHSFLEGPCFDAAGRLHVVDIPNGRILRLDSPERWEVVAEYEGWPNGMALRPADGALLIADYRRGLLALDPGSGRIAPVLETALTEGFKGLNDLVVHPGDGSVLFTDQGQTGLQDPTGRVFRLRTDGGLDRLIATAPSPNGIALNRTGTHCYVAMTRSSQVWRFALRPADAMVGKANLFCQLPGGPAGPDGMAVDAADRLWVTNPGHGIVWGLDPRGVPVWRADCTGFGLMPTNCCVTPDGATMLVTESASGTILAFDIPPAA
ncbi:MAG: SMP-30/gluconolactonase/LRE family protein [Acetobacteraceae bacterium]|nr:SMP-30/gluconolactonase/LRE family protein [Acetobacteraceae bacterium]